MLAKQHIKRLLKKYLLERVDDDGVEKWANAIENREDIGFESGYEELIKQCNMN